MRYGIRKQRLVNTLFGLALTLLISACFGNGEPNAASTFTPGGSNTTNGTTFFDLDPTAVCTNSNGLSVFEYEISLDGPTFTAIDTCSGDKQVLTANQLIISQYYGVLVYQGRIYLSLSTYYAEAFCQPSSNTVSTEILIGNSTSFTQPEVYQTGSLSGLPPQSTNFPVQVSTPSGQLVYQTQDWALTIDLNATALATNQYPALLQVGTADPVDFACTVGSH